MRLQGLRYRCVNWNLTPCRFVDNLLYWSGILQCSIPGIFRDTNCISKMSLISIIVEKRTKLPLFHPLRMRCVNNWAILFNLQFTCLVLVWNIPTGLKEPYHMIEATMLYRKSYILWFYDVNGFDRGRDISKHSSWANIFLGILIRKGRHLKFAIWLLTHALTAIEVLLNHHLL